jgi:DNA-binding NarL/FixJ family response regulator
LSPETIRVLIVDDHPIVHDGVSAILRAETDIHVIGSAETIAQALDLIKSRAPDVVLLDLRLGDSDGLAGVERIMVERPGLAVIMFTAFDADEYVFGAIRAGAKGYVLKGSPGQDLVRAIRQVHAGDTFLSPAIGAALARQVARPRRGGVLSARELSVLRLVAAGQSNQQIAESLGITERTVKFHVTAVFNKLGADNRAQAVAIASRRGLLP